MRLAFLILSLSLLKCEAPATFAGTASFKGTAQFSIPNNAVFNNLTHAWLMEEASGNPRLDSKGSANLSESAPIGQVAGKHGNAAYSASCNELDGSFSDSQAFSYSMWLKLATFDETSPQIFTKTSGITSFSLGFFAGDSGSRLTDALFHTLSGTDIQLDISALNIQANQWFFAVITFDGATGNHGMSINGGTFTNAPGTVYSPGAGAFTIVDSINCREFAIDELYSFNVVLSQSDVATLYSPVFYHP